MKILSFFKPLALALMLFSCVNVYATDYYVSTSGNNSNNGTSASTPWQSLSKVESVCNSGSILPGDRILFKKGDTFTGKFIIGNIWGKQAKSGTATNPITFGSYGTGAKPVFLYPQGGTTTPVNRLLMWFVGVDYYVIDGLNFTDSDTNNDKITPANCGIPLYFGASEEANSDYCVIQNVDISLCGMGIVLVGNFNKVTGCSMSNFKNLKSTNGGDDDYGANAITIISGNDNEISKNYIAGAWSASLDYGWNGGACEIFNSCHRNKLMYNTFYDCGGISEFGAYEANATANDNVIAYNKIINCGGLSWCNISGNFAIQVSNLQYLNNVIIENTASRFSGPNTGLGLTSTYQALIGPETLLFAYNGSPTASSVFVLKNNVFNLTTGIDVIRSSDNKTAHTNNVYKLTGGSSLNAALNTTELSTAAAIFTNTTPADPIAWNYAPITGSPVVDFGVNVGIAKDFIGNPVPVVPNSGILESAGPTPTLTVSAAAGAIPCNGGNSTITVTASGGTAPYVGTGTFSVVAGTYSYTVTDAAGSSATSSATAVQPAAISVTVVGGSIATYGGTTSVTVVATGGTGVYSYKLNSGSYQAGNIFAAVSAGSHSVTVKDANGCTSVKSFTLTQPAAPAPLVSTASATVINCNGASATVTVSATGGVTPYTGTGDFSVTAGTYTYTVTDANGTTSNTSITVNEPSALALNISAGTIAAYGGTTIITANASGGTSPYTFKRNGSYQSSNTFSGVGAGSHSITVKDANGCTTVRSIVITEPAPPAQLVAASVAGPISCNGGTTTVTVSATGGVAPYSGTGTFVISAGTYSYTVTDANAATATTTIVAGQPSPVAISISAGTIAVFGGTTSVTVTATGGTGSHSYKMNNGAYQTSNTFSGIAAGNHAVTVKDANGCTTSRSFTLNQPAAPAQLIASATAGNINCNGGSATVTVTATGGTAPYTGTGEFTVSAGTYNYTVTDANGATSNTSITVSQPSAISVIISAGTITTYGGTTSLAVTAAGGTAGYSYKLDNGSYQPSNSFNNVPAGNHSITIKDANGCTSVKNFNLTQPAAPAPLVATSTAGTIGCNGGSTTITVAASGGVAPYSGTGTFTVAAGTHSYTITDANGATATTSVSVTQPNAVSITITAGTISTYGGTTTVTVMATGGTGAFSYKLNNGSYQSSNVINSVPAGAHTITVKDANGCTGTYNFTITQPAQNLMTVTATATPITCNGNISTITVSANGGTAPYTGTGYFTAYAGSYSYTVTDATGATASTTLNITQPSAITINANAPAIVLPGGTTTITISATGGTSGYNYSRNGGAFQASNSFSAVPSGVHSITVKDANGCTAVKTITIQEPTNGNLRINLLSKTNVNCRGGNSGSMQVLATGGRAPYSYKLNNGRWSPNGTFRNLSAGIYRVYAKDASGSVVIMLAFVFDGLSACPGSAVGNPRVNVNAYPNPASDRFTLAIESQSEEDVHIEVMNMFGRKVFETSGPVGRRYIFGENLQNGTYFIKVTQGNTVKTTKVIKIR